MRGWDTFISLEALLKNMVTSLRAVSELQNPAIRERHWRQLMAATKVKIVIDENTVLDDLLQLNLHLFEDEVRSVGLQAKSPGQNYRSFSSKIFDALIGSRSRP